MQALLEPQSVEDMPTVKSWLKNAHAALTVSQSLRAERRSGRA